MSRKALWQALYLPRVSTISLSIDPRTFFNIKDRPYDLFDIEIMASRPAQEFASVNTGKTLFSIFNLNNGIAFLHYEHNWGQSEAIPHIQYLPARFFPKQPDYGQPVYIGSDMQYLSESDINKVVVPYVDLRGFIYFTDTDHGPGASTRHLSFFAETDYLKAQALNNPQLTDLVTSTVDSFEAERGKLYPYELFGLEKQDHAHPPFSDRRFRYCLTQIVDKLI